MLVSMEVEKTQPWEARKRGSKTQFLLPSLDTSFANDKLNLFMSKRLPAGRQGF